MHGMQYASLYMYFHCVTLQAIVQIVLAQLAVRKVQYINFKYASTQYSESASILTHTLKLVPSDPFY